MSKIIGYVILIIGIIVGTKVYSVIERNILRIGNLSGIFMAKLILWCMCVGAVITVESMIVGGIVQDKTATEEKQDVNTSQTEENEIESDSADNNMEQTQNNTADVSDVSYWIDSFTRVNGPSCNIFISDMNEQEVLFALGIGGSGSLAYCDLRDCKATMQDGYAQYILGSGEYELNFIFNEDGTLSIMETEESPFGLHLSGVYVKDTDADYPNCEYVFPFSNEDLIYTSDCEELSALECKIARNEIYARHGRKFADESLQNYFDCCSWYEGTVNPEDFTDDLLNGTELDNLQTISAYEIEMGYK